MARSPSSGHAASTDVRGASSAARWMRLTGDPPTRSGPLPWTATGEAPSTPALEQQTACTRGWAENHTTQAHRASGGPAGVGSRTSCLPGNHKSSCMTPTMPSLCDGLGSNREASADPGVAPRMQRSAVPRNRMACSADPMGALICEPHGVGRGSTESDDASAVRPPELHRPDNGASGILACSPSARGPTRRHHPTWGCIFKRP